VAAGREVHVLGPDGAARASFPSDAGATAVGRAGDYLVLGFKDGNLELVPVVKNRAKPTFTFEDVPSSPVVQILPGPRGTVIFGFANGVLGLFSLENGARLEHARLHGPVIHLVLEGTTLHAASELGGHLTWNLGVFFTPYCDLLRQVWAEVPLVWEGGLPVLRAAPRRHPCRR
jgi:hypothetical protein